MVRPLVRVDNRAGSAGPRKTSSHPLLMLCKPCRLLCNLYILFRPCRLYLLRVPLLRWQPASRRHRRGLRRCVAASAPSRRAIAPKRCRRHKPLPMLLLRPRLLGRRLLRSLCLSALSRLLLRANPLFLGGHRQLLASARSSRGDGCAVVPGTCLLSSSGSVGGNVSPVARS